MIRNQLNLFLIALGFLTRIPVPDQVDFSQDKLNSASRYFPLVGWLIGGICGLVLFLSSLLFPIEVSVLLSMLLGIFLTGCFHEDGLADTCDGFGGGWLAEQKLLIMKDSRLGTYGATGLWFVLSFKFFLLLALSKIDLSNTIIAILIAHPLSRAVSTSMIFILPYVTDPDTSKVKPLAESHDTKDLIISLVIGCSAMVMVLAQSLWIIIVLMSFIWLMRRLLLSQIKGFTGDTLGATQQISELLIYLVLLATGSQL